MATISIEQLSPGFELIVDEETYLDELTDGELDLSKGGSTPAILTTLVVFSAGYAFSNATVAIAKKFL